MSKQKFPPGWDEKRVKELIAHYENQTEDEEFADIEAAREAEDITLMAIPTDLVPEVRALLARKQSACKKTPMASNEVELEAAFNEDWTRQCVAFEQIRQAAGCIRPARYFACFNPPRYHITP